MRKGILVPFFRSRSLPFTVGSPLESSQGGRKWFQNAPTRTAAHHSSTSVMAGFSPDREGTTELLNTSGYAESALKSWFLNLGPTSATLRPR